MSLSTVKMDTQFTGMWVNFFTAAGIPSDVSATYALTFTENRIQNDMLLDLNKEYLRDMGITRMGDVIAILRHAKQVDENRARDRVLSTACSSSSKPPVAAVTGRATASQPASPASRILEHYTRNSQAPDSPAPHLKRKSLDTMSDIDLNMKKARLIRFSASSQPTVTEVPSKTVFARLGNTEPSSNASTKASVKPIYARLGSKADEKTNSHVIPIQKDALKYEGILKSTSPVKKIVTITTLKNNVRKIAMGCTMRADETPISVKDKLALPKSKSVKFSNHVQYKEIEANYKPVLKPIEKTVEKSNQKSIPSAAQRPVQKFAQKEQSVQKFTQNERSIQKFAQSDRSVQKFAQSDRSVQKFTQNERSIQKFAQSDRSVQKFAQSDRSVQKFTQNERSTQKFAQNDNLVQKFTSVFNKPERRLSMPEGVSLTSVKSRLGNKSNVNNLTITTNVFKRLGV